MHYTTLGKTGIKISKLCFGTMTFGGEADEKTSATLYNRCRQAGINLFDCANIYHEGRSEQILGKLIKPERQDVVITSKVYFPTSKDVNSRGLSRKHIMHAVEQSLERLDTDYIDIYFMHHFDEEVPLEESLRALTDLRQQGKILYVGVSNFAAWQIIKALGLSEQHGFASIVGIQPMYNLIKRQAEVEILPMAKAENIAVISYNPLAGGLLTGKYLEKKAESNTSSGISSKVQSKVQYTELSAAKGRLSDNKMYQLRYGDSQALEIATRFCQFSEAKGYSPVSLAIAWVAAHPAITSPLLGARSVEQLDGCLKSLEIPMNNELRSAISALSPTPPLATDRSDELKIAHT